MTATPVSLLERLKVREDSAAWDRFVQLYTPLLYYWVRKTGLQEADAADLVQDVLTVLVAKMPDFVRKPDGNPPPPALGVARGRTSTRQPSPCCLPRLSLIHEPAEAVRGGRGWSLRKPREPTASCSAACEWRGAHRGFEDSAPATPTSDTLCPLLHETMSRRRRTRAGRITTRFSARPRPSPMASSCPVVLLALLSPFVSPTAACRELPIGRGEFFRLSSCQPGGALE
jgi:hypothetical protein